MLHPGNVLTRAAESPRACAPVRCDCAAGPVLRLSQGVGVDTSEGYRAVRARMVGPLLKL